jgi:hypothetical protein
MEWGHGNWARSISDKFAFEAKTKKDGVKL